MLPAAALWPLLFLPLGVQWAGATLPPGQTVAIGRVDDRMTVPVVVAGAGPYRFVIDTGAERSVIARSLADALRLAPGPTVTLVAMTGRSRVDTVVIPRLEVSAVTATAPIQAPALEAAHIGAQGLLGIDALAGHRVSIDFREDAMTVAPSSRRARPPRQRGEIVVRARSLFGQLIVTDATYEGERIRVVVDTGANMSIGNSALRRQVARTLRVAGQVRATSITGGTFDAEAGVVGRVTLGDVALNGLPVAFADVEPFRKFGLDDRPALLLGMDALRAFHRVDIDFPNREIRLLLPRKVALAAR